MILKFRYKPSLNSRQNLRQKHKKQDPVIVALSLVFYIFAKSNSRGAMLKRSRKLQQSKKHYIRLDYKHRLALSIGRDVVEVLCTSGHSTVIS